MSGSEKRKEFLATETEDGTWSLTVDKELLSVSFPNYSACVDYVIKNFGVVIPQGVSARSVLLIKRFPKEKRVEEAPKKRRGGKKRKKGAYPDISPDDLIVKPHKLELVKTIKLSTGMKSVYKVDSEKMFLVLSYRRSKSGRVSFTGREYGIDDEQGALRKLKKKDSKETDEE